MIQFNACARTQEQQNILLSKHWYSKLSLKITVSRIDFLNLFGGRKITYNTRKEPNARQALLTSAKFCSIKNTVDGSSIKNKLFPLWHDYDLFTSEGCCRYWIQNLFILVTARFKSVAKQMPCPITTSGRTCSCFHGFPVTAVTWLNLPFSSIWTRKHRLLLWQRQLSRQRSSMTSHCLHWGRKGVWRRIIKNASFTMWFLTFYFPIKISDKTSAKKLASFLSILPLSILYFFCVYFGVTGKKVTSFVNMWRWFLVYFTYG